MGLTTWENSPKGKIVRSDVTVGKNYLTDSELKSLGLIVSGFLEMAESFAQRKIPMTMEDWATRLDAFLALWERDLLEGSGSVSAKDAEAFAISEFEKYRVIQDARFVSDFDRFAERVLEDREGSRGE